MESSKNHKNKINSEINGRIKANSNEIFSVSFCLSAPLRLTRFTKINDLQANSQLLTIRKERSGEVSLWYDNN